MTNREFMPAPTGRKAKIADKVGTGLVWAGALDTLAAVGKYIGDYAGGHTPAVVDQNTIKTMIFAGAGALVVGAITKVVAREV